MRCKTCLLDKRAEDFYTSNKTRCKECIKASVRRNRLENIEHYRAYDRQRASHADRVAAREAYAQTPEGRIAGAAAKKRWIVANAIRRQAHNKLAAALKGGKVQRQPCFICGETAEAHHPDYSMPLTVTWLCPKHHKEAHRQAAEILYAEGKRETLHF